MSTTATATEKETVVLFISDPRWVCNRYHVKLDPDEVPDFAAMTPHERREWALARIADDGATWYKWVDDWDFEDLPARVGIVTNEREFEEDECQRDTNEPPHDQAPVPLVIPRRMFHWIIAGLNQLWEESVHGHVADPYQDMCRLATDEHRYDPPDPDEISKFIEALNTGAYDID